MKMMSVYYFSIIAIFGSLQVIANNDYYVKLSHDGPVVLGGSITFRADVFARDGSRPHFKFIYEWSDNAFRGHHFLSPPTRNATAYYTVSYPESEGYVIGIYEMEVKVTKEYLPFLWHLITSRRIEYQVTQLLNGNVTIVQSNKTVEGTYVSSGSEADIKIELREGDAQFLSNNATLVSTYWFIDCKYYGQTNDYNFKTNFTKVNTTYNIEALIVASFESPQTISVNSSTASNSSTTSSPIILKPAIPITMAISAPNATTITPNTTVYPLGNLSFPFVCLNSSIIPPDPKKTYGYFNKEINVKAPIAEIAVEGTNWIRPWDMLSLNVTCKGSGPFYKCLQYHRGKYNITGNETCYDTDHLQTCNFSIIHYFLEPSVSTIVMILQNDVSTQIYPITVNIYSATVQPQLSVIIVPVTCSLVAIVLIIFGIAYYIQSRARFTVEVADFDFGKSNSEMEYKTFRERLRDSFNNAGYKPLHDSQILQ
ncbi:uncharacterized protein LOC117171450 isoform X2 [Belonocnema kinseyi]|uniref:uncharacterized protein LOC117171450 isoform X2 n=1 Tax=Belonocnema kinseyi TaxID=2817044 RepID=UPI00143D5154|nr:uncharacterized protein LOC117171450 isoform X2 [Belonocnema kinseyi]